MDPPSEGAECMLVAVDGKQIGSKRFPIFQMARMCGSTNNHCQPKLGLSPK